MKAARGGLGHAAGGREEQQETAGQRSNQSRFAVLPRDAGWMYLTCELSSFDQDRVDGNDGRDEEVTKAPLSV